MRYTDFLKTTVLLAAGEATALAIVTIAVVAGDDDRTALYFALGWWVLSGIIGIWLGRRVGHHDRHRQAARAGQVRHHAAARAARACCSSTACG